MSNLIDHAKRELLLAGYEPLKDCEDSINRWVQESILELLVVFSRQHHSNLSAPYTIDMFNRLAMFRPLTPLTGCDDEWCDVHDGLRQNIRYSSVFKDKDGRAYRIDGIVFKDSNGCHYTNKDSRVYIEFPYEVNDPEIIEVKGD